ncbi:MAG: transporter [Taibaiella sp.]|nr:transporter [Taibaiella sp.]
MKRLVLAAALLAATTMTSNACDICGCGAGSYYIGILPEFNAKILGLRYRSSNLTTHLNPNGERTYLTTDEQYYTTELWGGWTIKDRYRIMASVPLAVNIKDNETARERKTGLSDVSVQGFYRVLRSKTTLGKHDKARLLVQDLWVGVGVKAPTGKYNPADKSTISATTNSFQLGTGSWDFLFTGMYDIRLLDIGFNATASYKINTTNPYDYYYGNRFSGSAQLYHKFRFDNKFMIAPNLGINIESSRKDIDGSTAVRATGGRLMFATAGAEMSFEKVSIGGNWQAVVNQNLGEGAVKAGNRAMLHVSFMF